MANQNVGTPRFYIDHLQYIRAIGKGYPMTSAEDIFNLNPSSFLGNKPAFGGQNTNYWNFGIAFPAVEHWVDAGDWYSENHIPNINYGKLNYIAILGHNLGTCMQAGELNIGFRDNIEYDDSSDVQLSGLNLVEVVNLPAYTSVPSDGFSIATFDDYIFNGINLRFSLYNTNDENKIGSLSVGQHYDMPHSPELSLTMSHEYDGVKKQETAGGSTFSQANYYKPPKWGALDAWRLSGWLHSYSGRRVWNLSFNYLSDKDLEPYHYHMDRGMDENVPNELGENPNWNDNDNWFTNVLYYTNGGQLPFIFCPDSSIGYFTDTWTKPEFAICRFDMKTFKRQQVANGIYNIKVKIKESW